MFKLLGGLVGFAAAFVGATSMFWFGMIFEHRPAGWPNIPVNAGFIHFTFHLPDGPAAQAAKDKAALKIAVANVGVLQTAVNEQNAAIQRNADLSADALADAEDAIKAARQPAAQAVQAQTVIAAAASQGPTACDRAEAIDKAFVGTIK